MEKTKKQKRSTILRYAYIGVTILIIVIIGLVDPDFAGVIKSLKNLDTLWLFISVGCIIAYWFTDALLLGHITSYLSKVRVGLGKNMRTGMIGLYYGALTPSATGGQPMQVVYMRHDGINVGTATSIVGAKFIAYELALCSIYVVSIIFRGPFFYSNYGSVFWITLLGFAVNLFLVVVITVLMFNRAIVEKGARKIIGFLGRFRVFQKDNRKDRMLKSTLNAVNDLAVSAEELWKHKARFFVSYLISVLNLAIMFAVTYCVYRAMGHSETDLMSMLSLQAFLYIATSLIPTPGSAGASEGGFYLFYASIYPRNEIFMGMLIWRFLSYYMVLILGTLTVVGEELRRARLAKKGKTNNEVNTEPASETAEGSADTEGQDL